MMLAVGNSHTTIRIEKGKEIIISSSKNLNERENCHGNHLRKRLKISTNLQFHYLSMIYNPEYFDHHVTSLIRFVTAQSSQFPQQIHKFQHPGT